MQRGVVPVLIYDDPAQGLNKQILIESDEIVYFLLDVFRTSPRAENGVKGSAVTPQDALKRYKAIHFINTYFAKVNPLMFKLIGTDPNTPAQETATNNLVTAVKQHIEPLLTNDVAYGFTPFFTGGHAHADAAAQKDGHEVSVVEMLCAPFILRLYELSDGVIFPVALKEGLQNLPGFHAWTTACMSRASVIKTWDGPLRRRRMAERLDGARAKYKNA